MQELKELEAELLKLAEDITEQRLIPNLDKFEEGILKGQIQLINILMISVQTKIKHLTNK